MKLAIVKSSKELGERALYEVKRLLKVKPNAVIGFAENATAAALYDAMARDRVVCATDYSAAIALNLNEYIGVDSKDPRSCAGYMRDRLFGRLNILPENIFVPDGTADNLEEECRRYAALIREYRRDLQILGIGVNGRIAFNEPHTPFDEPVHIAALTAQTKDDAAEIFGGADNVPAYALTAGAEEILQADEIVLVAAGARKAQAVYNMICGKDDGACPAAALRRHKNVTVILDGEAAELLRLEEWSNGVCRQAEYGADYIAEAAADMRTEEQTAANSEPAEAAEDTVDVGDGSRRNDR